MANHKSTRAQRRETKQKNRRKMKVSGASVKKLRKLQIGNH